MRVNSSRHTVKHLALEARMSGKNVSVLSGDCSTPVELHAFGYPDKLLVAWEVEPDRPIAQHIHVRCRKCPECLGHRRRLWTARAIDEIKFSSRSWFGTLTLAPDRATQARYAAHNRLLRRGIPEDEIAERIFGSMVDFINPEISRFFARLRKKTPFRYLLVAEAHKSGLPHWHTLIHEYPSCEDQEFRLPKAYLEEKWRYGFSHWRLVDVANPREAGYISKYLTKEASVRIRNSEHYGSPPVRPYTERVIDAATLLTKAVMAPSESEGSPPRLSKGTNLNRNNISTFDLALETSGTVISPSEREPRNV